MQIQINTDRNIDGSERLTTWTTAVVEQTLSRVSDRITRVVVHLSDVNGDRSGEHDKRCMIEARLEGRQPVAITHQAATMDQAVNGAAEKLISSIESTLGRLRDQHRHQSGRLPDTSVSPDEE